MKHNIEKIKEEIVEKLKPLKPKKIFLFGSYAYGNPDYESDLDICVVEYDYQNRIQENLKIRSLLSSIEISKDILNPKLEEYEFYKKEPGSVYREIEEKGELLYSL